MKWTDEAIEKELSSFDRIMLRRGMMTDRENLLFTALMELKRVRASAMHALCIGTNHDYREACMAILNGYPA